MALDPSSTTWRAVHEHCSERIARARQDLEGLGCTEVRAQQLRGEIAALRGVLNLSAPPPKHVSPEDHGYSDVL